MRRCALDYSFYEGHALKSGHDKFTFQFSPLPLEHQSF